MEISVSTSNLGTVSDTYLMNATARVVLNNNDCRLGFVDANANNIYDTGETVILDSDCNGRYGSGSIDPRIRFIGAGTTWAPGNTVVIDADTAAHTTIVLSHAPSASAAESISKSRRALP